MLQPDASISSCSCATQYTGTCQEQAPTTQQTETLANQTASNDARPDCSALTWHKNLAV